MFWIRADGNAKIGMGHLMRCMTLAQELALQQGSSRDICFVCADDNGAAFAEGRGIRAVILGTDYRDMESELPIWKKMLEGPKKPGEEALRKHVFLVDSYFVTDRYLASLKEWGVTALMDDLGTHGYPVDCVINYNLPADLKTYERLYGEQNTDLIVGTGYVPVRRQFVHVDYQVREQVRNVLITTGGGDSENIAGQIWKVIYRENYDFHLVTGRFNPHFRELKEWEESCDNLHIYHDVTDMAGLMKGCDIAVTAGGSTIYELAAVGVPFISFSYADNQEEQARCLDEHHIAPYAGAWHRRPEETLNRVGELFEELSSQWEKRKAFHENEIRMTDGKGAVRLAKVLSALACQSRRCG